MPAAPTLESELLETLILRGWYYFSQFETRLRQEQQDVKRFLDNYLAKLGVVPGGANVITYASRGEGGETPGGDRRIDPLHFQQKRLYRQLMKRCHPDSFYARGLPDAAEWLRRVNRAYSEGDGLYLCRLALRLERECLSAEDYAAYLRAHYAALRGQVAQSRTALQALRASPDYRLKQTLETARAEGMDLMRPIRRALDHSRDVASAV